MELKADSEFMGLISAKATSGVLKVVDGLMAKLMEVNPGLYRSVMENLKRI